MNLTEALATIEKQQERIGAQEATIGTQEATIGTQAQQIESLRSMIQQQRLELEKLLEKYVYRKKIEMPDVKQPVFAELLAQLGDVVRQNEAAVADQEAAAAEPPLPKPPKKRRKHPGRQTLPAHLERRTEVLDLPAADRIDPLSGKEYPIVDRKRTERLECVPARLYVQVIERVTRALPGTHRTVETPELPPHVFSKWLIGTSFAAEMLVKRFDDHLPFDRQAKALRREGVNFHRNDLDGWFLKIGGEILLPIHEALVRRVLATDYVCFDDTPIRIQIKGDDGKFRYARIWICRAGSGTGPPLVFYRFSFDKGSDQAIKLLGDFKGYAQADAAGVHDAVMRGADITELGCWAHATRNFNAAAAAHPQQVGPVLQLLRELYDIEELARHLTPEQRYELRQNHSAAILHKLYASFDRLKLEALPKSPLAEAVNYCLNQKQPLHVFLEDGRLAIDNNHTERGIRPWGRGRINWLFFGNEKGGLAAAVVMSLIQSCRNVGINPWIYLKDVLDRLPTHPADAMQDLLPGVWKPLPRNAELGVPVFIDPLESDYRPI